MKKYLKNFLQSLSKNLCLNIIIFFCTFFAYSCHADAFLQTIGECISDPCNCGHGQRTETWNGVTKTFDKDLNCAPYNRSAGRVGCIKQFNYPGNNIDFFHKVCAEESPDNSYESPKIRIRSQACNFAGCWHEKHDLNWDGQCRILAGPYALPMVRMCARIATENDPGYTANQHINAEGATEQDEEVYDYKGDLILLKLPKICVYSDPSLLALNSTDVLDILPLKQSFHKTSETHPVIEVIIFFL